MVIRIWSNKNFKTTYREDTNSIVAEIYLLSSFYTKLENFNQVIGDDVWISTYIYQTMLTRIN